MNEFQAKDRALYREKLSGLIDNDNLVFITGVRGSGKTCIGIRMEEALRGREDVRVLRLNIETIDAVRMTAAQLVEQFRERHVPGQRLITILDEVIRIPDWETAVNELFGCEDCKLILISSRRSVLSERVTAVQEGRFDVVNVLPLSLPEFLDYHGFEEQTPPEAPIPEKRYRYPDGRQFSLEEIFSFYLSYGGIPFMRPEFMDRERSRSVMDGCYSVIVTHDVLENIGREGESAVTDAALLRSIVTILGFGVGSHMSATRIGKKAAELLSRPASTKTVESYLRALTNANLIYAAERLDVRTNQKLKTLAKYYIVDTGLQHLLTGLRSEDPAKLLENKLFFELLRRGYEICSGKVGQEEIHLVAVSGNFRTYFQVTDALTPENEKAVLQPLHRVRDSYPKIVLTLHGQSRTTSDGIMVINALEYLMGKSWML